MANTDSLPSEWEAPPPSLSLPPDEVQVWAIPLDQSPLMVSAMVRWLSPVERTRAGRFHSLEDCKHYVIAHGVLREVLGRYLKHAPSDVLLCTLPNGKPVLAPELNDVQLEFNLSHSHELALIAVSRERRLGIDVERIRAVLDGKVIAARFFAPGETVTLSALPERLQLEAFFACWTRKEAYIKARGEGLRISLDTFAVAVAPGQSPGLLYDVADPQAVSRWSLHSLDVGAAYVASLAVEGQDWRLRHWLWQARTRPG